MKAIRAKMAYEALTPVDPENPEHTEYYQMGLYEFKEIKHKDGYVIDFVSLNDTEVSRKMDGTVDVAANNSNMYALFVSPEDGMFGIYAVNLSAVKLYPEDVNQLIRDSWK